MPRTILRPTNAKHEAVYQAIGRALRPYQNQLSPAEILAILANMTGKVLALQDQRTMTPAMGLELIARNIEEGNAQAVAELHKPRGNA